MINPDSSKNPLEALTSDVEQLNEIVYILQSPPHKRKPEDLEKLYEIIKESQFFRDLLGKISKEACILLLKQVKHENFGRTRAIFNYGDFATKFFLILKGSVYIIAPKDKGQPIYRGSQLGQSSRQGQRPMRITRRSVIELDALKPRKSSAKLVPEDDLATPEEITKLYPDHIVLNTLKAGDHFGEIALQLNTTRSATAVCREASHFLTISPSIYNKILNDYYEKTQRDLVEFFREAPLTSDWPLESIVGLIYQTRIEEYKRNQIIYDIGDPCSFMYFVKEGEVELVKETRLNIPDDELVNKTMQTRHPVSFDKTKLMHLNYLWRHQYSQAKTQHIRIALLGKYQNFGSEEFTQETETRKTRAIVKSATAEIFIVSYRKFVENKNNPRDLCRKLLGIEKSSQKEWRGLFETSLIKNRLASNEGLEKALSKFEQELTDCISLLNNPEEFSNDMNVDVVEPHRKLKIPINKAPLKLAKSVSPSTRRREASLDNTIDIPLPKSPNLPLKGAKKAQFVRSIRPEAKEVKVVFKSNKTVCMDPSMVSVCLDLASHTFQGSKMYQSCHVSQTNTAEQSFVKEPESAVQTPGKHLAFLVPRTESLDVSYEKSPVSAVNKKVLSPLNTSKVMGDSRFESKSAASLIGKRLEELVRSKRKLKKPSLDQPFQSLSINSMFMNKGINPDLLDDSRINTTKREEIKSPLSIKMKARSPESNPCYISGSYLPRRLPPKRSVNLKKSPQRKGLEEMF